MYYKYIDVLIHNKCKSQTITARNMKFGGLFHLRISSCTKKIFSETPFLKRLYFS